MGGRRAKKIEPRLLRPPPRGRSTRERASAERDSTGRAEWWGSRDVPGFAETSVRAVHRSVARRGSSRGRGDDLAPPDASLQCARCPTAVWNAKNLTLPRLSSFVNTYLPHKTLVKVERDYVEKGVFISWNALRPTATERTQKHPKNIESDVVRNGGNHPSPRSHRHSPRRPSCSPRASPRCRWRRAAPPPTVTAGERAAPSPRAGGPPAALDAAKRVRHRRGRRFGRGTFEPPSTRPDPAAPRRRSPARAPTPTRPLAQVLVAMVCVAALAWGGSGSAPRASTADRERPAATPKRAATPRTPPSPRERRRARQLRNSGGSRVSWVRTRTGETPRAKPRRRVKPRAEGRSAEAPAPGPFVFGG